MTRWAVFSDIHGNLPALHACVADAEAQGCDGFLNLGDILSGPLWPVETADFCMSMNWPTITGNHERQLLTLPRNRMGASDRFAAEQLEEKQVDWLRSLPASLSVDGLRLCHGSPRSDVEHLLFDLGDGVLEPASAQDVGLRLGKVEESLVLCGHTHIASHLELSDGTVVVNPGSVGLQAYDDDHPRAYRVENGDPKARFAIVDRRAIEIRLVDYDWEVCARRAEQSGRPDWADALRTGHLPA